jgi:hypothetical protein
MSISQPAQVGGEAWSAAEKGAIVAQSYGGARRSVALRDAIV